MCGRFAITTAPEALRKLFGYSDQPNFPPRYNIAPTQPVPVVTLFNGERRFMLMRWGFMPGWVKDPKDFPLVINIRAETAREKPSFRAAFLRRRALMPADVFYEWQRAGKASTPFLVTRANRETMAFPALHETWTSPDGSEVDTVAMVTTTAPQPLAAIHHRSPVILNPTDWARWLDPDTTPDQAEALLVPPADGILALRRIGTAVNKVSNDGPEIQNPVEDEPTPTPVSRRKQAGGDGQGSLF